MKTIQLITFSVCSFFAFNLFGFGEGYGADVSNTQQRAQNLNNGNSSSYKYRSNRNQYDANTERTNPSQELSSSTTPNYYSNSGAQSYMQAGQGHNPSATPAAFPRPNQNAYKPETGGAYK